MEARDRVPRRIPGEPEFVFPSPCCRKVLYNRVLVLTQRYGLEHVELDDFHGARVTQKRLPNTF